MKWPCCRTGFGFRPRGVAKRVMKGLSCGASKAVYSVFAVLECDRATSPFRIRCLSANSQPTLLSGMASYLVLILETL